MSELDRVADFGLGWLDAAGPRADIVLATRVRLARNLQGHPFGSRAREADREAVFKAVEGVVEEVCPRNAVLYRMDQLGGRVRRILLERHLISKELLGRKRREPPPAAAVAASAGDPVSMMVNEEDHLRLQALQSGLRFGEAWRLADELDEETGQRLPLAYHPEFGYLTSCPTNTGTGLRASALVHLPGLVLTKEFDKVHRGISQVGLTFRNLHGEGSRPMGNFFQVSNQTTLGKSEEDLVEHLERVVGTVIQTEMQARNVLMRDAAIVTEDKIWRAYGLLRHARTLGYEELVNLLSGVRLGLSLKLLPGPPAYTLNQLMVFTQTAHIHEAAGRALSRPERHAYRADYVRAALANGAATSGSGGTGRN